VPALQVSSVAFGGPDLRTLFITTAAHELDEATLDRYPGSGWLHRVDVPVPGLAVGPS
jgi:D-xylonolactonase